MIRTVHATILSFTTLVHVVGCSRPDSVQRLSDTREILSTVAERRIEAYQQSLLEFHDIELAVDMPDSSPADLSRYAHDLMEVGKVGASTSGRRGLLLVVDVKAARVRFEVGPDLEHVFPDAFVSRIENNQMAPFFREGRVGDGVEATVELLVARVNELTALGEYAADSKVASGGFSAGAGATARTPIGSTEDRAQGTTKGPDYPPARSPANALDTYVTILSTRDARPDLKIYSPETRMLLADRLITPAQQDNEYRLLRLQRARARIIESGPVAVALFDAEVMPPYFFRRGVDGWMVDLATPSQSIRFDQDNRWFFVNLPAEYSFAFD